MTHCSGWAYRFESIKHSQTHVIQHLGLKHLKDSFIFCTRGNRDLSFNEYLLNSCYVRGMLRS